MSYSDAEIFKSLTLIYTIVQALAPAPVIGAPLSHSNWTIEQSDLLIVRGKACQMLQDGQSSTAANAEIINQIMDRSGASRRAAKQAARIIVGNLTDCRTSTVVITKN